MKTFGRIGCFFVMMFVGTLFVVSCGNAQKNKVQSGKPIQDSTSVVIQESEVVVEIDSVAPDSIAQPMKK